MHIVTLDLMYIHYTTEVYCSKCGGARHAHKILRFTDAQLWYN